MKSPSLVNPTLDELVLGLIGALSRAGVEFRFGDYYAQEQKRIKDNETKYSKSMVYLDNRDKTQSTYDISDGAIAVHNMFEQIDASFVSRLRQASSIVRQKAPFAHRTFELVVKNGTNRKESIACLVLAKRNITRRKSNTTAILKP